MNQTTIGKYIARKRKEQNLTQEQLAQQLGVSNKTIYKWETGKCMPDYSIIHKLCTARRNSNVRRGSSMASRLSPSALPAALCRGRSEGPMCGISFPAS